MRNLAEKRAQALALKTSLVEARAAAPEPRKASNLIRSLVDSLAELGVRNAFGVSGGAIALLFDAIEESTVKLHHFRHESGAAFAAAEAYFATGRPSLVFATTGPGALNALTGMTAAKWDGAKVILITGATSVAQRGRWATQETSPYTFPQDALYARGALFDFGVRIESPTEFPEVVRRLALGLARPGGFVAHVSVPMAVQAGRVEQAVDVHHLSSSVKPTVSPDEVARLARLLKSDSFAIWVGFGARGAAPLVRDLMERSGAHAFASPRAKGVVAEGHPQYLGVSGLGGHTTVNDYMLQHRPARLLVLGSRLGEATSFWDRDLLPTEELIHVDIDPEVPGTAFPQSRTIAVHAEIGTFLTELIEHFPVRPLQRAGRPSRWQEPTTMRLSGRGPVRPQVLMEVIQQRVIHGSDAIVLAECGNSFAWCNHYLRFDKPGRYRVSTLFGSMGHVASGVVGAALARDGKAWAVVGDGSMLMNSEISSAAQYQAKAVWVVLNDAGYGMCRDGQRTLGLSEAQIDFPKVDFASLARSMGAEGVRVETEEMLEVAFQEAEAAEGPFVIDVSIDPKESSPLLRRFESLIKQGSSKNVPQQVAGWDLER
jgi:acetolactate synthase-1/2/3 large subunit